jgi:hypothetical protein
VIYRIYSLGVLVVLWAMLTGYIGKDVSCKPIDAGGVLTLIAILCIAWLLGFMSRKD